MLTNQQAQSLHDRATRGEAVSAEEQADLEAWYAVQDENETVCLQLGQSSAIPALRANLGSAEAELQTVSRKIHEITAENDSIRRDVVSLRVKIAQQAANY
jgi:hypothetical protein